MDSRSLSYVADATHGKVVGGRNDRMVCEVSTDSRTIGPGALFVALQGPRFDGHDHVAEAARRGAAAALVCRRQTAAVPNGCPAVAVDDTREALGRLAARYRKDFDPTIVAVGGSNGKTTTKELIAQVLNRYIPTLWSEASYNNDVGVPLTLLRLESRHRAAVVEVGTNHPGELAPLLRMVQPQVGVITNIGREHLEFFQTVEAVSNEEGVLAEVLPSTGTLFLSADNEWCSSLARRSGARISYAGESESADWRASEIRLNSAGVGFELQAPVAGYSGEYHVALLGRHQVAGALFAVAIAAELGVPRNEVEEGLAGIRPVPMRMELLDCGGVGVLDDSYNANADSMLAALRTLAELPCQGRRIAVLGDMAELGTETEAAHEEVGRHAADLGVGQVFTVGKMAPVTARAARAGGLNRVLEFKDVGNAAEAVKSMVKPGDLVLLKGSRAMRLERISRLLCGKKTALRN